MPAPPRAVLERCLHEAGYTPPRAALPELLAQLAAGEVEAAPLERALARSGATVIEPLLAALASCSAGRPRLVALAARLASGLDQAAERSALLGPLLTELNGPDAEGRKWAARALGKLGDAGAEPALLSALGSARGPVLKSLIDALALLGGTASLAALRALDAAEPDLARRRARATELIERRLSRGQAPSLALDRELGRPHALVLGCRAGLARLLAEELRDLGLLRADAGLVPAQATEVGLEYAGTLRSLLRARLAQEVAIRLPLQTGPEDPTERIAATLCHPQALAALAAWTEGAARFRVAWSDGGHHRARAWALAQSVRRRSNAISNDSAGALWSARVRSDGTGALELSPRLDPDPRFAYRVSEVRAASHPTLAAALARVGGVRADDVVWDPFVGSGLELVERARLGAFAELWGSDIDPHAIAAARANLDAAGVPAARLVERSALEFAPQGVSLVLTNPPMGRRVARDGSLAALLEGFVRHVARALRPGGRLVWLSPLAAQTARSAGGAGLIVRDGPDVDLGGFSARLQICERPL
jgi:23S rRNA G2445 N2-methylase RlmL